MSHTILKFNKVRLQRNAKLLIDDITFQLGKGEHLAIVGPSGSGKSSLLEAIARKSHIQDGQVRHPFLEQVAIQNQHIDPVFAFYHLISLVPAKHAFRDLTNTSSNLYYQQRFNSADSESVATVGDHLRKVQAEYRAGKWTLSQLESRLNLLSLDKKQLIKLSNGETKRLMLASALIKSPLLLLMDHPLTGLDPETRENFDQLLSEIADAGITIIMTTAPGEIPEMISHVAVISDQNLQYLKRQDFDPAGFQLIEFMPDQRKIKELVPVQVNKKFPVLVEINDVTIQYDDTVILKKVNWKINKGERWLLKGHNGAGKSTLLSLINADNPQAYSKEITLFGRNRGTGESIFDIKRKIGFVSAELYQYFSANSSCSSIVESGFYDTMGLFRPSNPEKQKICLSWMDVLGIGEYSRQLFKNVPESVQRLCLLARALVKSPPLLILDEPCQGLDTDQQRFFKALVEAICHHTNISLIYVSHFQEEVPDCLTYVLELCNGEVVLNDRFKLK